MKRLLVLAGAITALIVLVGAPAAYAADTLYVNASTGADSGTCGAQDSPCQTISQAVANAGSGDTIVVAAGTYDETVTIYNPVTLEGAQAGNSGSAARASESPATESVITGGILSINASDVTIDGFSFGFSGNQITVGASDATIENNVFAGYGNDSGTNDAIGVNNAEDTTITDNYFTSPSIDYGDYGGAVVQWYNGGCSGTSVSDNIFDNADASALADIYFYCDDESVSTITVSGNQDTIGGDSSFVNFQHIGGSGAEIDVTDNAVTMTPASGSSGMYFATAESGVETVNITGNSLTGDPYRAVKLSTNAEIEGPVSITGNDFSGDGVGVYVAANALLGGSVTLRGNNLSGETGDDVPDNADGVYNSPSSGGSVDAIDNWWGCNFGPGASGCSDTEGDVTADPWLVLGISASPATLGTGGNSTVTADLTHDSNGADASGTGILLDGTSVAFATDLGHVSAASAGTTAGKVSVTLTSSNPGNAHVSATVDGQSVETAVAFNAATASESTLTPASSNVIANGSATQVLTVQAKDAFGDLVSNGGATVTITKLSGLGTIGSVTDNGDGTYSATVTSPTSSGVGVFVATFNGNPVEGGGSTQAQATIHFFAQPTITSFSPGNGGVGTTVTVTGTHFTGATHVRLNGTNAAFTVVSDTTLTFTVPAGATTGTITVVNAAATATSATPFTVAARPTITSISPGTGPVGTVVTITGTNLTGTVGVEIGHIITVPTSVSGTQVTFTVPPGAASGTITILNPAGSATSAGTFTVT